MSDWFIGLLCAIGLSFLTYGIGYLVFNYGYKVKVKP